MKAKTEKPKDLALTKDEWWEKVRANRNKHNATAHPEDCMDLMEWGWNEGDVYGWKLTETKWGSELIQTAKIEL